MSTGAVAPVGEVVGGSRAITAAPAACIERSPERSSIKGENIGSLVSVRECTLLVRQSAPSDARQSCKYCTGESGGSSVEVEARANNARATRLSDDVDRRRFVLPTLERNSADAMSVIYIIRITIGSLCE